MPQKVSISPFTVTLRAANSAGHDEMSWTLSVDAPVSPVIDEIRDAPPLEREKLNLGFLMAYVGHQIGDDGLVLEGLGKMAQADPKDPLLALLQKLWPAQAAPGDAP